MKKFALIAALGMSMASAPVMAQTAQVDRAAATMEEASEQGRGVGNAFGRGTTTYVIAFFVIIVIALGIYFALDDSDEDGRATP